MSRSGRELHSSHIRNADKFSLEFSRPHRRHRESVHYGRNQAGRQRYVALPFPLVDKPEIVEYRLNSLVFGLRPSPSILGETIAHHPNLFKQSEPEMFDLLSKSLYVDDLLTGEDNDERAFTVNQKSKKTRDHDYFLLKKIMASGGFNLSKWNSNSRTLLKPIQVCEGSQQQKPTDNGTTAEDDESYAKSSTTLGNSE